MTEKSDQNLYEVAAWLRKPQAGASEAEGLKGIREALEALGGTVVSRGTPSLRRLAYPIKNEREGLFTTLETRLFPDAAANLPQKLYGVTGLLRVNVHRVARRNPRTKIALRSATQRPVEVPSDGATKEPRASAQAPKPEIKMEELDKKLEELLKTNA